MSTILEALRKLQAEREQPKQSSQELRSSLVQANYAPRPVAPARRFSPVVIGVASGAAVILIAVGGIAFLQGSEETTDPLELAASMDPRPIIESPPSLPPASQSLTQAYQEPSDEPVMEDEIPQEPEVVAQAEPEPPPTDDPHFVTPRNPATVRTFGGNGRSRRPPARNPVVPAPSIERPPAINFQPPAEEPVAQPYVEEEEYTQESVPPYVPPDRRDPDSENRLARASGGGSSESRQTSRPRAVLSGPEAGTSKTPSAEVSGVASEEALREEPIEAAVGSESQDSVGFPEVRVESVTWHPDRSRRRTTISIDGVRSEDLREGDLMDGLFIDRIEPGSVDVRVGTDLKRVSLGS